MKASARKDAMHKFLRHLPGVSVSAAKAKKTVAENTVAATKTLF